MRACNHADNLACGFFKLRPYAMPDDNLLADRILLGKVLLGQRFVDQSHARRTARVLVGKLPPAKNRNLEQLVVVGRRAHPSRARGPFLGIHRLSDDREGESELALNRQAAGKRRILHPGNRVQPLPSIMRKLRHPGGLFKARAGQRHLHGDDVVRINSRIHGVQRKECPDQQRRTDQQHQRQRHLADHQQ